ncbi:hypothetical protein NQ317_005181 [Molorchus minor]|uniref:Vacuolar protein sorting-associated protein 51 homolog n=1 Tax=Molorchus minor TaxID=1323400 RepID=A0ABQ9JCB2_9CUCU|nr:hypothetical protein NQ317_005181 [Molorchus minor]
MEEKNYIQATQDYLHAQRVLQQYGDLPSFQGIKADCEFILKELKMELKEPAKELCLEFLSCAEKRLSEQLVMLKDQIEQRDIIEFVDLGCSGFLSDLCLVVASFHDMFINRVNNSDDVEYSEIFENFGAVELDSFVKCKVDSEQDVGDTSILVQALDRFIDE